MAQIDYFMAPMSPFTYLAGQRLEAVAAKHGATIRYIPLDPTRLFPRTGGQVLADRHEARKVHRLQEIRRWSVRLGLPLTLNPPYFPVNGAVASYAIIAAQMTGGGDLSGLVAAFPRAVWSEGRNIADEEVVQELLATYGFDPKIADRLMLPAAETYAANLEEAVARGVFGVPFYLVGDERFWGQDRIEDLDLFLSGKL